MSNIQDVARLAGVSVATVSRVLNNSPSVTGKTRENVLEAIRRLSYQPNLLARNLRRTETKMVLVLLPSISNPFYSRLVKGIEDVAHKNGYNIMLCNTDSDISRERVYLDLLKRRLSDGVIFMAPELSSEELSEIGRDFPVVQCCEYKEGAAVSHITIDNRDAAEKAVRHLIGLGHKRIGMITCGQGFVSTRHREEGYRDALANAGLDFDPELVKIGDYGFNSGLRAASQLISLKDRPTAIFSISDVMAVGAMRAIKNKGLRVPGDIAIVGFDNISISYMCDPLLTTISQPKYDLGCTAMEQLLKQIRGEMKNPREITLEYELVIRESTVS
jgi:LacI family repressor for deo operon, udp, cdd, tsx, nupC, and nupG